MIIRLSIFLLACLNLNIISAQCISGNCANGVGKYQYQNGDVYEGDWANSIWNGKGKYTWKNGGTYEGAVKNNYFEGYGVLIEALGEKYVGNWMLGK